MSKPGRFPYDHPDPCPPIAPAGQLLDATVIKYRRGGASVFDEDLSKITTGPKRETQSVAEELCVEQLYLWGVRLLVDHCPILSSPHRLSKAGTSILKDSLATRTSAYGTDVAIEPGLRGTASMTVTEADLATSLRSGDVPVLATPRVVALLEEATLAALDGALETGQTSVGMRIHVDHLAPSLLGSEVVAEVELEQVDGRRLTFTAKARGRGTGAPVLASATITRVLVDTKMFLERLLITNETNTD